MAKGRIIGKHTTQSAVGETLTTLHLACPFEAYYTDIPNGKNCVGNKVKTLYLGNIPAKHLEVGSLVRYSFGEAIRTKKGEIFQPIEEIEVIQEAEDVNLDLF